MNILLTDPILLKTGSFGFVSDTLCRLIVQQHYLQVIPMRVLRPVPVVVNSVVIQY